MELFWLDFKDFLAQQLRDRTFFDWLFWFAPLVVFAEIPRYYFPLIGLAIAKWFHLPRRNTVAVEALMHRAPLVSVIVAGRNESHSIERCIRSLLEQSYPNIEIIVVDDCSDDGMDRIVRRFAAQGLVRFLRNSSGRGRGGRPSATNLGIRMAQGEFIVSLDADTSFDRDMIREMISPFADPAVGVVAGNVLADNGKVNMLTRLQEIEYILAIDIYKRWSDLIGGTLQASGALGSFRRAALADIGGWDPELAEDTDVSLRMLRMGWRIGFAPKAVALTDLPESALVLKKQRTRWDRGGLRTFFMKHYRLFHPSTAGFAVAYELTFEFLFAVVATFVYPIFLVWLVLQGAHYALMVVAGVMCLYALLSITTMVAIQFLAERPPPLRRLILPALVMPFYKDWLRSVRLRAYLKEVFLLDMDDPFLPSTAWANSPKF